MQVQSFEVGPLYNNVYVVWCGETLQGMIIDPAGGAERVLEFVSGRGLKIKHIIITHAHPDHVAGAAKYAARTGAELAAHPLSGRIMKGLIMRVVSGFGAGFKVVGPQRALADGETLEIGRLKFSALYTPGHSRDSISIAGHGAAFVGDLLFAGSVGRSDIPGGNHKALLASIKQKILPLGRDTAIYPGHGPSTTVGQELRVNIFLKGL